jgi:hypothetical protein
MYGVNNDNPNCSTCGRHLGIPDHDTAQHAEALERAIEEARD